MHAYMIIAHNQFELLERLILALDDERNDIYIHIDSKVKDFDFDYFKGLTKHSKLTFTDERINITWGDFSQVKSEMVLLRTAVKGEDKQHPYEYYHLISGVDLPIKSNDEIHSFFAQHSGKEFIHYTDSKSTVLAEGRLRYYHFFRNKRNTFYKFLSQLLLRVQKLLHVNRLKKSGTRVQKGANWFSITGSLAHYIVENMGKYEKMFRYSYCGDETFIQAIVENSGYKKNLFMPDCNNNHFACARLIDWERGNPYVWRKEDYDYIKSSPCMFARKFDINIDREIIDMLLNN